MKDLVKRSLPPLVKATLTMLRMAGRRKPTSQSRPIEVKETVRRARTKSTYRQTNRAACWAKPLPPISSPPLLTSRFPPPLACAKSSL